MMSERFSHQALAPLVAQPTGSHHRVLAETARHPHLVDEVPAMNHARIEIARAQPADVPVILTLIRELAEFERLLDQVTATEEAISESLFGSQPRAEVLLARIEQEVAGFALFFHNYSTFLGKPGIYLEDLFVRPRFRGTGCGQQLLRHLAAVGLQRGCGRLEWAVLNWNQRAIEFYRKLGAVPMDEWTVYRLSGQSLVRMGTEE
jgi:GNAT superfamily N-acetyltransferase